MSDKENWLNDIINETMHAGQPHTILGERGQQEMKLKEIQICECFLRGMLEGGTYYWFDKDGNELDRVRPEILDYHHLIDLIFKVKWRENFDPVAIVQCAGCHLEKVLGIYPNVPKIYHIDDEKEQKNER